VLGPSADDWIALSDRPLPLAEAQEWAIQPGCGAVVTFCGTVRDHAPGRPGVTALEYEAYDEQALARMGSIVAEARVRWPVLGRVALLHRTGHLGLGEVSVVVVVSAPHRQEAFAAAHWAIDTLKASVPIWKRECWADGSGWATGAQDIVAVTQTVIEPG